jgi:hypothetical protein
MAAATASSKPQEKTGSSCYAPGTASHAAPYPDAAIQQGQKARTKDLYQKPAVSGFWQPVFALYRLRFHAGTQKNIQQKAAAVCWMFLKSRSRVHRVLPSAVTAFCACIFPPSA